MNWRSEIGKKFNFSRRVFGQEKLPKLRYWTLKFAQWNSAKPFPEVLAFCFAFKNCVKQERWLAIKINERKFVYRTRNKNKICWWKLAAKFTHWRLQQVIRFKDENLKLFLEFFFFENSHGLNDENLRLILTVILEFKIQNPLNLSQYIKSHEKSSRFIAIKIIQKARIA